MNKLTNYKIRLKLFLFDLINGIYSRIPFCCVWFFCKRSLSGEHSIGQNVYNERNPDDMSHLGYQQSPVNYVRCDKCYNNDKVADVDFTNGVILKSLTKERNLLKNKT